MIQGLGPLRILPSAVQGGALGPADAAQPPYHQTIDMPARTFVGSAPNAASGPIRNGGTGLVSLESELANDRERADRPGPNTDRRSSGRDLSVDEANEDNDPLLAWAGGSGAAANALKTALETTGEAGLASAGAW